jgi:hypothetical protein
MATLATAPSTGSSSSHGARLPGPPTGTRGCHVAWLHRCVSTSCASACAAPHWHAAPVHAVWMLPSRPSAQPFTSSTLCTVKLCSRVLCEGCSSCINDSVAAESAHLRCTAVAGGGGGSGARKADVSSLAFFSHYLHTQQRITHATLFCSRMYIYTTFIVCIAVTSMTQC